MCGGRRHGKKSLPSLYWLRDVRFALWVLILSFFLSLSLARTSSSVEASIHVHLVTRKCCVALRLALMSTPPVRSFTILHVNISFNSFPDKKNIIQARIATTPPKATEAYSPPPLEISEDIMRSQGAKSVVYSRIVHDVLLSAEKLSVIS